jgi:hypothetical protein
MLGDVAQEMTEWRLDQMAHQPSRRGQGFFRLFERGVDTATRSNVTAYGYSVSITAAFALLQTSRSDTGTLEIFAFAGGAVVAFALVGALASGGFREELEDQPSNVKALGGAFALLSVGLALATAFVVGILIESVVQPGRLVPSLRRWPT